MDDVRHLGRTADKGWRALKVDGPLPAHHDRRHRQAHHALLASAGIRCSRLTYDTDYLLDQVREHLERAVSLLHASFTVASSGAAACTPPWVAKLPPSSHAWQLLNDTSSPAARTRSQSRTLDGRCEQHRARHSSATALEAPLRASQSSSERPSGISIDVVVDEVHPQPGAFA